MDLFFLDGKCCTKFFFYLKLLTSSDIWCPCKVTYTSPGDSTKDAA